MTINIDILDVLRKHKNEEKLGAVAHEALRFLEGAECKILQTPGPGQSSYDVVRMYKIRMSLPKFKRDAFIGLEESIDVLGQHDVTAHLSVIETEKGLVSVWCTDAVGPPIGIVIAKFLSK